ncbi:hypothetical protein MAR_028040 [Mya arenaria]|uniref:HAT C-terminal dimerisation domain-containing protein n=1 Tax=Mya arenaria TaxID=6604 RepID=A0ABY7DG89_MYAAR|nr:hypothetical protein MAR_028040 [Mya arenaria]
MSKDGVFCAPCFLFGDQVARSKAFTREPFTDWCNFSKIVERHSKSQCHIDQLIAAENYLAVLKGQKKDIECTISSQLNAMVEKNRQILVTVVTTLDRHTGRYGSFSAPYESLFFQAERNDNEVWNSLFQKAVDIAGDVDVIPAAPRRYGRQQNRLNAPGNTSEFWKRNMYFLFVLIIRNTRDARPWLIQNDGLPRESINDVYQAFHACLDVDETLFVRECERWRMWWTDATLAVDRPAAPASLAESITLASKTLYPSIRHCLTLLMVMPVSTATAERLFSVMRRVKTYLRSTMGTERLSGLGLMNVYKDREISAERVVDKIANQQNRRLAFVFKV